MVRTGGGIAGATTFYVVVQDKSGVRAHVVHLLFHLRVVQVLFQRQSTTLEVPDGLAKGRLQEHDSFERITTRNESCTAKRS